MEVDAVFSDQEEDVLGNFLVSEDETTPCENDDEEDDDDDENAVFIEAAYVDLTNESDKILKKLLSNYEGFERNLSDFVSTSQSLISTALARIWTL